MNRLSRHIYWGARTAFAWSLAAGAVLVFACSVPGFLRTGNLYALVQIFTTLAMGGVALAIVMIARQFDLSIAGTFPLAGLVAVHYGDRLGVPLSFACALGVGIAVGLLNGWAVGLMRVPSLAVTVATMILSTGIGYVVADNNIVSMRNYQPSLDLTRPILGLLSIQSIIELVILILAIGILKRTWWGRFMYAIGGNEEKARASGLPVTRALVVGFVLCAGFVSVAGALQGISLATGTPGADNDFLLQAATAALIGGVALSGGRGSLVGVVGGALLLSVLTNGLGLAGVNSDSIEIVNGAVLVGVVALNGPLDRFVLRRAEAQVVDSATVVAPNSAMSMGQHEMGDPVDARMMATVPPDQGQTNQTEDK
jgi:ribose transport system permease protein